MPKLFYGCDRCHLYRECIIREKYGDECPVEAFEKAKKNFKEELTQTKLYKWLEAAADVLNAAIEYLHHIRG